ncbi:hypothetical protein MMC07_001553 [Pseudocyphellaria aurata]|nr:hypothetical protein [Pseudocyphellaria aurata]
MILRSVFAVLLFNPFHQASATISSLQHIFSNPDPISASYRIPTIHESAVQARRILRLSNIATASTVFPSTPKAPYSDVENRPEGVAGAPIGLIEYYASCGPHLHDPTILALSIATSIKNARAGSNVTLSLRYHPPVDHAPSQDPYTYSPANLPRFSLIGHIELLSMREVREHGIKSCFLQSHPDAKAWTPGNDIHESWWARLVVEEIYWIGGFGDRAYIGWIPVEVFRAVTAEEVNKARLAGEEGWVETNQ